MSNALAITEFFTVMFTVSPLIVVGVLFTKDYRSQKQVRMQRAFKAGIQRSSYRTSDDSSPGRFILLEFCVEAEVSAKVGKRFLHKKVEEFSGVVDVSPFGDEIFLFGEAKTRYLEEEKSE
ncbi:hypothetical protein HRE53_30710 (plasmid) [Acaryochloris sp. 'Moss Beach']|uniref:hypothetical protein n=1 Tax=Acaryochloris sp. 'Moss Beach' TaxID=2740837 RepID=UPI001F3464F6|nr:hypothetical protein [Acaryochloris sp. 'Moss Beach']UJB72957.1 hypothetical protein HRE53_30710 [Acaryochloris sp. 'Moss Beach']